MPRAIKRLLYLMVSENILVPARQKNPRNNKIQKWKGESPPKWLLAPENRPFGQVGITKPIARGLSSFTNF
jgi:hypothetical protein